jgi:hypothetical protein
VFLFVIALIAECEFKIDKYPERKDHDGFTKSRKEKKTGDMNTAPITETEEIIDVIADEANDITVQKEAEQVNIEQVETETRSDESVELSKKEGYNNKDINKGDDHDDYYEIVIEE